MYLVFFVDQGVKINQETCRSHSLKTWFLRWRRLLAERDTCFSKMKLARTQQKVSSSTWSKMFQLLPPDHWPPSSPDLNPLDYGMWSVLKQKVYREKNHTLEQLKRRIKTCWEEINQDTIDSTIDRFRMRVHKMLEAKGKRFEHPLKM